MIRPQFSASCFARALCLATSFATFSALPEEAQAQQVDEFGAYRPPSEAYKRESSRDFSFELRFGPYLPRVDQEFTNGAAPFNQYFGKSHRLMLGAEFDWLPMEIPNVLRLGVGAGISYTSMSAKAIQNLTEDVRTAQDTGFRVLPQWVVGVAKLDVLARRTPIPVIFVGKLGLANALWWVSDDPSANSAGGVKGRGMSYGAYYGIGAGLDLGALDPWRAKRMDTFMGINGVYLYGELYGMELADFGLKDAMHVGDRNWLLGLSFDF